MEHVTTDRIDAFRHNRLADPERRAVARHLAGCTICSARAANDPAVNAAAAALRDDLTGGEHPEIEDLFAFVDGDLPTHQAEAISDHLRGCARCREDVDDASRERAKIRGKPARRWLPAAAAVLIAIAAAAWWLLHPVLRPFAPPHVTIAARPETSAIADEARRSGAIAMPDVVRDLRGSRGVLRGPANATDDLEMRPAGVVVATDRPELTWRASAADRSIVTIVCNDSIAAVSGRISGGRWTPEHPLPRGSRCVWQRERLPDHTIFPQPPAPQPAFRVLDAQTLASIERADGDDFLAGVLYARAGAQQEAEEHLERYTQSHPNDAAARSVLDSILRW